MDAQHFKQMLLNELYAPYQQCTMCPLGSMGRQHVVFGEGNPDAQLIIIGEGPGAKEDEQNRPFIGRSGTLLTRTLQQCNMQRENLFITNIVKCRPPHNRTPTATESNTCKNLLLLPQISIIQPKVICTLGSAAIQAILNKKIKITQLRGTFIAWENILIMPTYHPAYILRNSKKLPIFIKDIKAAIDRANRP